MENEKNVTAEEFRDVLREIYNLKSYERREIFGSNVVLDDVLALDPADVIGKFEEYRAKKESYEAIKVGDIIVDTTEGHALRKVLVTDIKEGSIGHKLIFGYPINETILNSKYHTVKKTGVVMSEDFIWVLHEIATC